MPRLPVYGLRSGLAGRVPEDAVYLTPDECAELEEGALVGILWSGGNGPAVYEVQRRSNGAVHVLYRGYGVSSDDPLVPAPGAETYEPGTTEHAPHAFVGLEKRHTRVWRVLCPCGRGVHVRAVPGTSGVWGVDCGMEESPRALWAESQGKAVDNWLESAGKRRG
jgi:hypothetical protein